MKLNLLTAAAALACSALHAQTTPTPTLDTVTVTGTSLLTPLGASNIDREVLNRRRGGPDTTTLLSDIPGVSLYGSGGVSSLPVIHGLADDRLRVQVDGMNLISACANHMNMIWS